MIVYHTYLLTPLGPLGASINNIKVLSGNFSCLICFFLSRGPHYERWTRLLLYKFASILFPQKSHLHGAIFCAMWKSYKHDAQRNWTYVSVCTELYSPWSLLGQSQMIIGLHFLICSLPPNWTLIELTGHFCHTCNSSLCFKVQTFQSRLHASVLRIHQGTPIIILTLVSTFLCWTRH